MWRLEYDDRAKVDISNLTARQLADIKELLSILTMTDNPRLSGGVNGKFWCYKIAGKVIKCTIVDAEKLIRIIAISL